MQPFIQLDGLVAPMDRANVDTDLMVPKQFLKSIRRAGFGPNLFDELRYLDVGEPDADNSQRPLNPDFPLNFDRYQGVARVIMGAMTPIFLCMIDLIMSKTFHNISTEHSRSVCQKMPECTIMAEITAIWTDIGALLG